MSTFKGLVVIGKSLYYEIPSDNGTRYTLHSNVGELECLENFLPDLVFVFEDEFEKEMFTETTNTFVDSNLMPGNFLNENRLVQAMLRYTENCITVSRINSNLLQDTCASKIKGAMFKHCYNKLPRCFLTKTRQQLNFSCTQVMVTDCISQTTIKQLTGWSENFSLESSKASICVIDMDDVLIDEAGLYDGSKNFIKEINSIFDKTILWSHGSSLHVEEYSNLLMEDGGKFDLVLNRNDSDVTPSKNLLHLYNILKNIRIGFAALIDDTPYNYTDEYDVLIVPERKKKPNYDNIISVLLNNKD